VEGKGIDCTTRGGNRLVIVLKLYGHDVEMM